MPKTAPEFEKSFADLAYSYINNNAPKILDYMVGFQVLDADDDETYAVGVFGFSVGGKDKNMFYAPVVFTGGKLKGQELLYHAKSDLFLPLNEQWVDFILNKKPIEIGESTEERVPDLARYLPNFRDLLGRGMAKGSAADYDPAQGTRIVGNVLLGQSFDIAPVLNMFVRDFEGEKRAAMNLDLATAVKTHPELLNCMAHRMRTSDDFTKAASVFYDVEDFIGVYEEPSAVTKHASTPPEPDVAPFARVYTGETGEVLAKSAADKQEYMKSGYTVVDNRDDSQKRTIIEGDMSFCAPTSAGYYDFIMRDGSVKQLIYFPSASDHDREMVMDTQKTVCERNSFPRDKSNTFKGFKCVSPLSGEDSYVTTTTEPIAPLDITMFDKLVPGKVDEDGELWLVDESCTRHRATYKHITISDNVGRIVRPKEYGNFYIVPRDTRVFTTHRLGGEEEFRFSPMRAGDMTIHDLFPNAVHTTKKASDGRLVFTDPQGVRKFASTRVEAVRYLIEDKGLTKEAAEYVADKAAQQPFEYVMKRGSYTVIDDYYPQAQAMDDDNIVGVDTWSGAPISTDITDTKQVLGLPHSTVRSHGAFEPDTQQLMQSAVKTDQKDLFDVSALSALIESTDVSNIIDKYLPDMSKSVDKIGRSLFSLYVHTKDFEDRYGAEDLADLEGTLKNAFDIVGKLVLFMKKRSIKQHSAVPGSVDLESAAE